VPGHCRNIARDTNLVTQQATRQGTDHGTGDLVLILDRRLTRHRHVLAQFTRGFHLLLYRLHVSHLGDFSAFVHQAVGRHSTSGSNTDSTQHRTHQH